MHESWLDWLTRVLKKSNQKEAYVELDLEEEDFFLKGFPRIVGSPSCLLPFPCQAHVPIPEATRVPRQRHSKQYSEHQPHHLTNDLIMENQASQHRDLDDLHSIVYPVTWRAAKTASGTHHDERRRVFTY